MYPEWQLARPAMPSRTRLYSLEPIGIGTPETESLTSYVSRLAEAHSVRVRELVMHELLPLLGRSHLVYDHKPGLLSAFWRNESRALNGTRMLARNLVHGLEVLTGRRDLRFLTMVTWTDVLPRLHLQKRTRAWCPACFEEWRQAGRAAYDSLVWTLAPVIVCSHHRQFLRTMCPFPDCRLTSPWLSSRSRPGCCARCGRWLGNSGTLGAAKDEVLVPEEAVRTHAWIFQATGELIAAAPGLPEPPRREHFIRAIQCSLRSVPVSRRVWARQLGLAEGTVLEWRKGQIIPSLWCLLVVSSHFGVSPLQLVCDQIGNVSQTSTGNVASEVRLDRPPLKRTPIDRETVRAALEAILVSDELPPPSLREVATRIGQTYRNLHENLPELSGAIAARYRAYQEAQGARSRARLREEVRRAVFQVHRQGYHPNSKRVGTLLSRPGSLLNRTARSALYEALRDLGWWT